MKKPWMRPDPVRPCAHPPGVPQARNGCRLTSSCSKLDFMSQVLCNYIGHAIVPRSTSFTRELHVKAQYPRKNLKLLCFGDSFLFTVLFTGP